VSVTPRVLFVSKPVVPPWHDGSKNLVRDIAAHLVRARPTVLTTPGPAPLGPRVTAEAVYRSPGRFAPGVAANARVLARLLTRDPHDLWHFFFAPNPASSFAARLARGCRRSLGWRGKVIQTVASAPRDFGGVSRLLFGDVVVALSEWTRAKLVGGGADASRLRVIGPCAAAPEVPSTDRVRQQRNRHALGDARVVLYPGDYELSRGAATFTTSIATLARDVPDAVFVFACRAKTPRAGEARVELSATIEAAGLAQRVRHVGEVDDMAALLAASTVVAFPVDDLYGKVDLPLVLLEALALGVPLVLTRGGPLETITAARFVDQADAAGLAVALAGLLARDEDARALAGRGKELYAKRFTPPVVAAQYDDLYEELLSETP
jgi:phosphatidylinositol alpha-1,6-mannosyltransferase